MSEAIDNAIAQSEKSLDIAAHSRDFQLTKLQELRDKGFVIDSEFKDEESNIIYDFRQIETRLVKEKTRLLNDAELERQRLAEEARIKDILAGNIEPIKLEYNSWSNEHAYFKVSAQRVATVEEVTERTEHKNKRKGVISRTIVGGLLLGPVGALAGAATSGSQGTSTIIRDSKSVSKVIDSGDLLFTNKRVLFNGDNELVSLKYKDILVDFKKATSGQYLMVIKYPAMKNGEYYILYGTNAGESSLYYKGITSNLIEKE